MEVYGDDRGDDRGDEFGTSIGSAGDVDGDGHLDFAVASRGHDEATGKLQVFGRSHDLNGSAICLGESNSTSQRAALEARSPSDFGAAANDLVLIVTELPSSTLAFMLVGTAFGVTLHPTVSGVQSDGRLCITGRAIGRHPGMFVGPGSIWTFSPDLTRIPVPPAPPYSVVIQPGETWLWQCWYRDTGFTGRSNFSDAVCIEFH